MTSFNTVILVGRMTADPEIRYTPKGTALAKFTIALNRTWRNGDGTQGEEVSFIDCDAWGRLAETITQHFKKGYAILVQGRLKQNSWEDKTTQQKRSKVVVVVEQFQFVEPKREKDETTTDDEALTPQSRPTADTLPPEEDDVPF